MVLTGSSTTCPSRWRDSRMGATWRWRWSQQLMAMSRLHRVKVKLVDGVLHLEIDQSSS
jgi:hypothetical protein